MVSTASLIQLSYSKLFNSVTGAVGFMFITIYCADLTLKSSQRETKISQFDIYLKGSAHSLASRPPEA